VGVTTLMRAAFAFVLSSAAGTDVGAGAGREVTIALDGVDGAATCPPLAALARALDAHLPGIAAAAPDAPGRDRLHLRLEEGGGSGAGGVRLALVDASGRTVLERGLADPGAGRRGAGDRAAACAVLAETIALVVERYLRQLGYRAPAPARADESEVGARGPPAAGDVETARDTRAAPPRAAGGLLLSAGVGLLPGPGAPARFEPELGVDWLRFRLMLSGRAALAWPAEVAVPATDRGRLRYTALPLRAGAGLPLSLPRALGWVAATAFIGVDLYRAEALDVAVPQRTQGATAVAELGLAAAFSIGGRLALRPHAALSLRREREFRLRDAAPASAPLYVDHPVTLELGIDFAIRLGKN